MKSEGVLCIVKLLWALFKAFVFPSVLCPVKPRVNQISGFTEDKNTSPYKVLYKLPERFLKFLTWLCLIEAR